MHSPSYITRRHQLQAYFDRTASETWARLTSDAPVSRIRATVREGRAQMRATILSWLPADMTGLTLLDAGCGTGALSVEAARRGARVVAIDVADSLVSVARERLPADVDPALVDFRTGDMLDQGLGRFDYVVAMDSLIHYRAGDMASALAALASRTERAVISTFAPRTPALSMMHAAGKLFPRSDRSPAIEPVSETTLQRLFAAEPAAAGWRPGRTRRIARGFYTSQALELVPA
ncbi:magnesium protoporphyrin IX methyltransferase [Salinarimonas ramus]|uniref:Magnesium protoporphyrin IX methyltransferase n=1 Tax=Salinarimonas ramus TaxID=690164 RepID=A0A917VA76_9HYPH|nr:magnesium protoporphyrin IX methyltransferase [Salinarimonas ramus]GGK54982.1 magnesium protoporphyrin IX methyltransferase [Salinarimonas ramus]